MSRTEERRHKIVQEIVDTERAYKDSLEFGVNFYMKALLKRAQNPAARLLGPQEISDIFQNLEMIYKFSCEFLGALEVALGVASNRPEVRLSTESTVPSELMEEDSIDVNGVSMDQPPGKEGNPAESSSSGIEHRPSSSSVSVQVGQVFSSYTPYFKLYIEYMAHYDKSMRALIAARDANAALANFLTGVGSLTKVEEKYRSQSKDIQSILIRPIQRIPRYRLLLEELLKQTPKDHGDYPSVEASVRAIAQIADHLNREMKDRADREKVYDIQNSFVNGVMFLNPRRRFVRDGDLIKICRKSQRKYYFVLFNDLLVYAHQVPNPLSPQKKYYLHRSMNLQVLRVEPLEWDDEKGHVFFIKSAEKSFKVICPDEETKDAWVRDITKLVESNNRNKDMRDSIMNRYSLSRSSTGQASSSDMSYETIEINEKLLRSGSILEAKVMQSHDSTDICQVCGEKFGFLKQKYNCENCGKVVCSNCGHTKRKFPKPDHNIKLNVRICEICFESLQTNPYKRDVLETLRRRSYHSKSTCWFLGDLPCFNTCFETPHDPQSQGLLASEP